MADGFIGSVLDYADWSLRTSGFDGLRVYDDGGLRPIPVMGILPGTRLGQWQPTRALWRDLPVHPNVLDAVDETERELLVRYAAIHWGHQLEPGRDAEAPPHRLATWGIQLVDAFRAISREVSTGVLGQLTNPLVEFDLEHQIRIGFLPIIPSRPATTRHVPLEVLANFPRAGERSLVYVIGSVLRWLWRDVPRANELELSRLITRAIDIENRPTLDELEAGFVALGGEATTVRRGMRQSAWVKFEAGLGMLALGERRVAVEWLDEALALHDNPLARWARDRAGAASTTSRKQWLEVVAHAAMPAPRIPWNVAVGAALGHESRGEYRKALSLYQEVVVDTAPGNALMLALARCYLALGNTTLAIEQARFAQQFDPTRSAILIEMRALAAGRRFREAIDRFAAVAPATEDAEIEYLRGKCLLGAGRLVEARETFERVLRLQPMAAALLMLREVERVTRSTRAAAGTGDAAPASPPRHLEAVHAMLIEGRTSDAIDELAREAYARDPAAQLMRGDLLLAEQQSDRALAVYLQASRLGADTRPAAVVGTGLALIDLGRPEEALEMFDHVPESLDALEGRARALDALGRIHEAETARKRHADACAARSDLRMLSR